MAQNHRIQFYVDGSAVRKLEPELPQKQKSRLPKPRKRRQPVVHYDPLAMVSLAVTALMLILMVAGFITLLQTHAEVIRMEDQVIQLRRENDRLQREYEAGYDLDDILQQNRKLKELMNISPSNLIRSIRLKQAAYLLINNNVNISEVAYKVGFSTHSYFSNSFHDYFGMTPKEFVARYMNCKDEETLKKIFE